MADANVDRSTYVNPLVERYASKEMSAVFSDETKFRTWRRLWIALAEAQQELGLPITGEQIAEMKEHEARIDFELARAMEKELRHDVMAHVHTYARACPKARGIIHLGATSAFVGDNTDIIQVRNALDIVIEKLANLVDALASFAENHRALPCLAFTHIQPAQLTTLGKRAALWLQDFIIDLEQVETLRQNLKFRGVKGTTGTQASFLQLFNGDHEKVEALDKKVAQRMGFDKVWPLTGQTYPRKADYMVLAGLAGIAISAHKMTNDIRLLQSRGELEEPFGKSQVGSSAMAYKRNPMRSERVCALARHVICNTMNPAFTAAAQFLERTLDDSANRRISIPEAFLAVDAILILCINITRGLVVYPTVIQRYVDEQLPFMATESILMAAVQKGGDRQALHERIRSHAMEAVKAIREHGTRNDLCQRIAQDEAFAAVRDEIRGFTAPEHFIGRSPQQVDAFIDEHVKPVREKYAHLLGKSAQLRV